MQLAGAVQPLNSVTHALEDGLVRYEHFSAAQTRLISAHTDKNNQRRSSPTRATLMRCNGLKQPPVANVLERLEVGQVSEVVDEHREQVALRKVEQRVEHVEALLVELHELVRV